MKNENNNSQLLRISSNQLTTLPPTQPIIQFQNGISPIQHCGQPKRAFVLVIEKGDKVVIEKRGDEVILIIT